MLRVRFHGRGGQGIKTASRILGRAFFSAGYIIQDAPRYGAERRGAPVFASVRASRSAVRERTLVRNPDLTVVADDSLLSLPSAGIMDGKTRSTVYLIRSAESPDVWIKRLAIQGPVILLPWPPEKSGDEPVSGALAGGAAGLFAEIELRHLENALDAELKSYSKEINKKNKISASYAFENVRKTQIIISGSGPIEYKNYRRPSWINLEAEDVRLSAPDIHSSMNSVEVRTGLWRTHRPVVDPVRCRGCIWICSTFCPDSVISSGEGRPLIDYEHCKGCMVCMAVCPNHAIEMIPEKSAEFSGDTS